MKNHVQNVVQKLFPRPFPKNQNCAYLWINILNVYIFCFYFCQVEDYRKWLKLSCRRLAFTSYKAKQKRSGTSLPASFSAWFSKKMLLLLHFWFYLLSEIFGNMYIVINCWLGSDVINFEINLTIIHKIFETNSSVHVK